MPKRKKIKVKEGDVFIVPLIGEKYCGIGRVIKIVPDALNSYLCNFGKHKFAEQEDTTERGFDNVEIISTQFVTPDLLDSGIWQVIGSSAPPDPNDYLDFDTLNSKGFVGVDIRGSGVIRKFLSAYHGQHPWNCYFKEDYLDKMLSVGVARPEHLIFEEKP